ncbi:MAG: 2-amino-4-hydroxy-6-hydroxymethyldihydropteridine diphosphokinase [Methylovulum sp.]|uniref:2-amino-4-hydroxy-6- hydroxymethyldihydropteridine diphosphokinase n=1 Tax=Methylovulum sp. TaxID=1916980 RepID=UPI00260A19C6|nr:2-amino-4-hydroxy-6-hydroxymethyldihydropteridine diphosphokinase [Methylovulum sp.]MDD2724962.1 2-amino-4-hydroxy-6-hydroxymethyldihydropteridine diphosphokinase [Methylovulum sp.]MDD5123514.1 2-amino-4-hydroxy-6-hydroxymethyldihydropteridine diphosphokinase [Methylovulum sp.]
MTRGFISIGSNIDRKKNIAAGLAALQQTFGGLLVSSVYEAEPVGFSGDTFYNLVVGFDSALNAKTVAQQLRQIEFSQGRPPDSKKFTARTLDLDLLLFGDEIVDDGGLQIPRVDIEKYAFVLEPLAEIAPLLKHPVSHKSYAQLWEAMPKAGIRQRRISLSPM